MLRLLRFEHVIVPACLTTALLGTLPIFIYWHGAGFLDPNYPAHYHVIAGRVPWSDGASFLIGAHNLIFDGELCEGVIVDQ